MRLRWEKQRVCEYERQGEGWVEGMTKRSEGKGEGWKGESGERRRVSTGGVDCAERDRKGKWKKLSI